MKVTKITPPGHIITKFSKTSDNEKILKVTKEKNTHYV